MKKRYIIGSIIIIAFVALAMKSFDSSKIEYADFSKAKEKGKTVQVIGSWVKEKDYVYNSEKNQFEFYMKDEKNNECYVKYNGAKPNNFDIAPMVVIKGKYESGEFHANEILTKCPSKYEGSAEDMK